jgi:uncharacterized protein YjiS (DUF1127 family)
MSPKAPLPVGRLRAGRPRSTWWRTLQICLGVATAPILLALERGRQRRALAMLDDGRLRDIGLTNADVRSECAKPIWRP